MTRYDFSPLFRSTVGFDRMMQLLDAAAGWDAAAVTDPPYNIEKTDENAYQITLAVAGFSEDDIRIELRENTLTITGSPKEEGAPREFLHHGIDRGRFERSFQLADYVMVVGATLDNGMLRIDLRREIPEELKPRRIDIAVGAPKAITGNAKKIVDSVRKIA